jgi:hypothetical protein
VVAHFERTFLDARSIHTRRDPARRNPLNLAPTLASNLTGSLASIVWFKPCLHPCVRARRTTPRSSSSAAALAPRASSASTPSPTSRCWPRCPRTRWCVPGRVTALTRVCAGLWGSGRAFRVLVLVLSMPNRHMQPPNSEAGVGFGGAGTSRIAASAPSPASRCWPRCPRVLAGRHSGCGV